MDESPYKADLKNANGEESLFVDSFLIAPSIPTSEENGRG